MEDSGEALEKIYETVENWIWICKQRAEGARYHSHDIESLRQKDGEYRDFVFCNVTGDE